MDKIKWNTDYLLANNKNTVLAHIKLYIWKYLGKYGYDLVII